MKNPPPAGAGFGTQATRPMATQTQATHNEPTKDDSGRPKVVTVSVDQFISRAMKPQHLLATACIAASPLSGITAFSPPSNQSAGRVRPRPVSGPPSTSTTTSLYQRFDDQALLELEERIAEINKLNLEAAGKLASPGRSPQTSQSLDDAKAAYGMPWRDTIGRTDEADPLLYMPFWEWQLDFMESSLTNLHPISCDTETGVDVSLNVNSEKRARIVNNCYASDEYRKIRMTYYDAGDSVQVFNSVWYPDAKYNLPVLGIDLLSFNRKKYLAIVDFQPLHDSEDDHAATYEHILRPVKEQYENLKGRMSSKFYDETKFFSKEMLFARFEDGAVVGRDLFPAFQKYVETHVDLVRRTPAAMTAEEVEATFQRQRAYDTYSASRDPAAGLFAAMFGKTWAEDFIYDFLFSLSERSDGGLNLAPPSFGGGPPPSGHGGNPYAKKAGGGKNPHAGVAAGKKAEKSVPRI